MERFRLSFHVIKEEECIGKIIADVLAQSYDDFELIVVSNVEEQEAQLQVINSYAAKDARIRVISVPKGGLSNALNIGMKAAVGDWLAFVDADDRLTSDHLELLANSATDDVDIVCGGVELPTGNSEHPFAPQQLEAGHHLDDYYVRGAGFLTRSPVWNKLFRRETINTWGGCFDTRLSYAMDALFVQSLLNYTQRVITIPMCGYRYVLDYKNSSYSQYHECWEQATTLVSEQTLKL